MAIGITSLLSNATSGGDVFSIIGKRGGTSAIQSIIDSAGVQASRQQFFNNVAMRIEALRTGQIEPSEDWEKVAAYLSTKGQPFVVGVDAKGQVTVDAQADTDLGRFNEAEKTKLTNAFAELDEMARRIDANTKNQAWVDQLENVPAILDSMREWATPPDSGWQTDAMVLQKAGIPFKVVLSEKGELTVVDQTKSRFFDTPPAEQRVMFQAIDVVKNTLKTGFSDGSAWAALAQVYQEDGKDYFLEIDSATMQPLVKRNDADSVVPKFLRTAPYPDIGADTPWKKAAAELIQQGKGFYLDIDTTGEIIVRANDGRGVNLLDKPRNATTRNPIVDLLV